MALAGRQEIGEAVGIWTERHQVGESEATAMPRKASQGPQHQAPRTRSSAGRNQESLRNPLTVVQADTIPC